MSLLSPQLIAFVAVAKQKTVHGAAQAIHLTQTAVTQRIRSLERLLKTTLFIRTRKGMKLTQEAEALLRYCLACKELEGETLAAIQGAGTESEIELCISSPTSIMRSRIIPCCLPIIKTFPRLLIHFKIDDIEHRHLSLRSGQTDFAIIKQDQLNQEMQYKKLKDEQYVLVASAQWKGRRLKDILCNERIIDFNPSDQITFDYLKYYGLFSDIKHSRFYVNNTEQLALLATEGIGYTTLTKEFATPYIKKNQLIILNQNKIYSVAPILAWYNRPEPPPYFNAIIRSIN